jgi:hypothetical protein
MATNNPNPNDFDPEREHQSWDLSFSLNQASSDLKILALQQKYLDLAASRGQFGIESQALRGQVLELLLRSLHLIPTSVPKENFESKKELVQPLCLGSCQKKGLAASALLQLQVNGTTRTLAPLNSIMQDSVLNSIPPIDYPLGEVRGKVYDEPVGLVITATQQPRAEVVLSDGAIEEDIEYAKLNTVDIKSAIVGKPYTTSPVISSIACAMALAQTRRDIYAHLCAGSEEQFYFMGVSDFEGPIGTTKNSCRFRIDTHLVTALDGVGSSGLISGIQYVRFSDHIRWSVGTTGLARTECLETSITRLSA